MTGLSQWNGLHQQHLFAIHIQSRGLLRFRQGLDDHCLSISDVVIAIIQGQQMNMINCRSTILQQDTYTFGQHTCPHNPNQWSTSGDLHKGVAPRSPWSSAQRVAWCLSDHLLILAPCKAARQKLRHDPDSAACSLHHGWVAPMRLLRILAAALGRIRASISAIAAGAR